MLVVGRRTLPTMGGWGWGDIKDKLETVGGYAVQAALFPVVAPIQASVWLGQQAIGVAANTAHQVLPAGAAALQLATNTAGQLASTAAGAIPGAGLGAGAAVVPVAPARASNLPIVILGAGAIGLVAVVLMRRRKRHRPQGSAG